MTFHTFFPDKELSSLVLDEIRQPFLEACPGASIPPPNLSNELKKGDFAIMMARVAGPLKRNPVELASEVATKINEFLSEKEAGVVVRSEAVGPYLNIFLNRPLVFEMTLSLVRRLGDTYGHSDVLKGKKAIVEHTSSNPNAPLHIGNLRNVLLGSHLAELLRAVGCETSEHFFINDLGAQIGLTALAYSRLGDKLAPTMKIDLWIGKIYAIMNTFSELQKLGQDLAVFRKTIKSDEDALKADDQAKLTEYIDIYKELEQGQSGLFNALLDECVQIPDIKHAAAQLNLAYERNEPEAVKLFRKMVTDCLAGVQKTLDTYGVKHQQHDFESELGWSGENDVVLNFLKASPYFVPPTQCNDEGKPEGGYLNLDQFIIDSGMPRGKRGFQKDYPNLYVLRPDGSTLYSFRDCVYSLKKENWADMVFNVICTEQNLAQEKVALALSLLHPEEPRKLFHVNYEYVRLVEGKMSGRRGRYLLADDLYGELRSTIGDVMSSREMDINEDEREKVLHEVAAASMKYALLSVPAQSTINFDMKKCTSFEDASAPFVLYQTARIASLQRKFEAAVSRDELPALPAFDDIDWTCLDEQTEWELLIKHVLTFPSLIKHAAAPVFPQAPALPEFGPSRICDFLTTFVRAFSSYYKHVRILTAADPGGMHARLYMSAAFRTVIANALRLLLVEPLEKM